LATQPKGKEPLAGILTGQGQGQLGFVVKGKNTLASSRNQSLSFNDSYVTLCGTLTIALLIP
jgi:hypothetical protein